MIAGVDYQLQPVVHNATMCKLALYLWEGWVFVTSPRARRKRRFSRSTLIWQQNGNVSWWRRAQIEQLAWPMAERQIVHQKSSLVFSARAFPSSVTFPSAYWIKHTVTRLSISLTLLFSGHFNLSNNITQTAVTNMMKQRMFQKTKILKTYALSHHVCYRSLCLIFTEVYLCWYIALKWPWADMSDEDLMKRKIIWPSLETKCRVI